MAQTKRPKTITSAGVQSFGERVARLRKERGLTQVEFGAKVGMVQGLISDYENGKLRPYADIAARFAQILEVSADELLGLAAVQPRRTERGRDPKRRFLRRAQLMTELPKRDQDALARMIDAVLKLRLNIDDEEDDDRAAR